MGAPIRSPNGDVVAALSISMPKDRFTADLESLLPERIKAYAAQVTESMKLAEKESGAATQKASRTLLAKRPAAVI